ncbi:MAG: Mur ligase domain-containing protein, partial [Solirubrobacteraceae bacterium]
MAEAAGAKLIQAPARRDVEPGPTGVTIDSRTVSPDQLFVGLRGERADGGEHAVQALAADAWGVLVAPEHAAGAAEWASAQAG